MGNQPTTVKVPQVAPQQFVTQAHVDWVEQMKGLYTHRPTLTKTVVLPAGVELSDPRLGVGVVVSEKTYSLPVGEFPEWPGQLPFECDVDGRLLPPCWGSNQVHAHYAIYPDMYFPEINCGYCDLHNAAEEYEQSQSLKHGVTQSAPVPPHNISGALSINTSGILSTQPSAGRKSEALGSIQGSGTLSMGGVGITITPPLSPKA